MRLILALIAAFLQPAIVFQVPRGQQGVDAAGANGLIGLMANVNAQAISGMQSYATTGNAVTIVPQDILNGMVQMNSGAGAGFTITLPSTQALLAALGPSVIQDGSFTKIFGILNNSVGQTGTLTAGDSPTSVIGTATVATAVTRYYAMRVMQSALVFTNIGALTL